MRPLFRFFPIMQSPAAATQTSAEFLSRYERAAVRSSIDQVLKGLATRYGLKVEDLMKGKRGKDNEARKVGMYLTKELCDLKLKGNRRLVWNREL